MDLKLYTKYWLILMNIALMTGCQNSPINEATAQNAPYPWRTVDSQTEAAARLSQGWLQSFNDPQLEQWIDRVINGNYGLEEARHRIEAARQQQTIARSNRLPTLDLAGSGQRRKSPELPTDAIDNQFELSATASWEADLWGRLKASNQASDFILQAEKASYNASRILLAGQAARAWFDLIAASQLEELLANRVENLTTNLDIISAGYQQGINSALDVYLARSDLATETSNLTQQREIRRRATRQLQLLAGEFPSGQLDDAPPPRLPNVDALDGSKLTTDLAWQRFDLQSSYLSLLAADRDLAAAHKARYPSLRITATGFDRQSDFDQLRGEGSLAWNLIAGLTQPIYAGGRLRANELRQAAVVKQREQQYLSALNNAFNDIERAMSNEASLQLQLRQLQLAAEHASAAQALSFDQYKRGLVAYTSVLEAQRRAFRSRNATIVLQNQLLQNRIDLHLALGGDYQGGADQPLPASAAK